MTAFVKKPPSRWGRKVTLGILLLVSLTWCWVKIRNPESFPVHSVKIIDVPQRINHDALRKTITPFLSNGMVWMQTDKLQKALTALPWVKQVSIVRRWPGQLIITLTEQTPAAHWNRENLLNSTGTAFNATQNTNLPPNLPWLSGPRHEASTVWLGYQEMSILLAPTGLKITAVNLSHSDAWEIELNNGMPLILGKDDVASRLKRFVSIYPKIFDNNQNAVEYIDLRYSNGLAVKWKT